jgi:hypothetical protein
MIDFAQIARCAAAVRSAEFTIASTAMEFPLVRQEDHEELKAAGCSDIQRSGLTFRAAH